MEMKLKQLYLDLPLRHKLLLWFGPLFLVTIAMTGFFSYRIASDQIVNKISQTQDNLVTQNIKQLDYIASDAIDFSNYLFLSSEVQEMIQSDRVMNSKMYSSISKLMVTRPSIHSLIIYSDNEKPPFAINQTGLTSAVAYDTFKKSTIYQQTMALEGSVSWHNIGPGDDIFLGNKKNIILLTKTLKSIHDLQHEGIVIIGINEEILRRKFLQLEGDESNVVVVSPHGIIITASKKEWVGKNFKQIEPFNLVHTPIERWSPDIQVEDWILSHGISEVTGWHTFVIQEEKYLLHELDRIKMITLSIMLTCLLMGLVISYYAGKNLTKLYTSKLKKREAELKMLQAQINPHLLYNTLNTITWSARSKGLEEVAEISYALGRFYQLTLSGGRDTIKLKEEFDLIQHYFLLQKKYLKEKLSFELKLDSSIEDSYVPKLFIQPFVENAIIHGINGSNQNGFISVQAQKENEQIVVMIMDNGAGMPQETLERLNQIAGASLQEVPDIETNTNSYGIINVKERLLLRFGHQATLSFNSKLGSGTKVTISIPNIE